MQAIQLAKYGEPEESLRLAEIAEPDRPKPGQILIRVEYAPINDNDMLLARGLYTIQPKLPKLNPFGLVSKRASIHPFFMHYPDNLPKIPEKIRAAAELVANHQLRLLIAAVYPVRRFPEALRHALGGGGKVLLDFTNEA
jgi:NADPH:quinone reductase-like Zn-dependent oxidoreductase